MVGCSRLPLPSGQGEQQASPPSHAPGWLLAAPQVVDDSDPDTALPQIEHLLQTAEACRKAFPEVGALLGALAVASSPPSSKPTAQQHQLSSTSAAAAAQQQQLSSTSAAAPAQQHQLSLPLE